MPGILKYLKHLNFSKGPTRTTVENLQNIYIILFP